jgi:hypothetical protein
MPASQVTRGSSSARLVHAPTQPQLSSEPCWQHCEVAALQSRNLLPCRSRPVRTEHQHSRPSPHWLWLMSQHCSKGSVMHWQHCGAAALSCSGPAATPRRPRAHKQHSHPGQCCRVAAASAVRHASSTAKQQHCMQWPCCRQGPPRQGHSHPCLHW